MSFDLGRILTEMSSFGLIIVGALGLMAVTVLTVMFERLWTYSRVRKKSISFGATATKHLRNDDLKGLAKSAEEEKGNPLAQLLSTGSTTFLSREGKKNKMPPVELAKRDMERTADTISAKLRRGLSAIASVGSTAPFVGLLGTVVGIIEAFKEIAATNSAGLGAVSAGISEALVVTAFGLVVAIPAVLVFNFLSTKVDNLERALDHARGEFVDYVEATVELESAPEGEEDIDASALLAQPVARPQQRSQGESKANAAA